MIRSLVRAVRAFPLLIGAALVLHAGVAHAQFGPSPGMPPGGGAGGPGGAGAGGAGGPSICVLYSSNEPDKKSFDCAAGTPGTGGPGVTGSPQGTPGVAGDIMSL